MGVVVYLSRIWLFWCFLAFYGLSGFFTHDNLAALALKNFHAAKNRAIPADDNV